MACSEISRPSERVGMARVTADRVIDSIAAGVANCVMTCERAASGLLKFRTGRSKRSLEILSSRATMLPKASLDMFRLATSLSSTAAISAAGNRKRVVGLPSLVTTPALICGRPFRIASRLEARIPYSAFELTKMPSEARI